MSAESLAATLAWTCADCGKALSAGTVTCPHCSSTDPLRTTARSLTLQWGGVALGVVLVGLAVVLAGLHRSGSAKDVVDTAGTQTVSIPLTQTGTDPSYQIAPRATVSNEDYGGAFYGVVGVSMGPSSADDASGFAPNLAGHLLLGDGQQVACSAPGHLQHWSGLPGYGRFDLKCATKVDLSAVEGFVVES